MEKKEKNISISINNIRAIKSASIFLDGINVISGENGSGKSTIAKLVYEIILTSINFNEIIEESLQDEFKQIHKKLESVIREMSTFSDKDDIAKLRNYLRRYSSEELIFSLFPEENGLLVIINYLIENFHKATVKKNSDTLFRLARILKILESDNSSTDELLEDKIINSLEVLIDHINGLSEKSKNLKEIRPSDILEEKIKEIFTDDDIPRRYNITEYGIKIIDFNKKSFSQILSFENVFYIDTPMSIGVDFYYYGKPHWNHLNETFQDKRTSIRNKEIDNIFKNEILLGEIEQVEDDFHDTSLVFKRNDGSEFNLNECATGIKSIGNLQLLLKNGYLNNKTLLIIDEPEAHLHPQWIVEYARLIVLLNKHLGVNFLLASHNPDMVSAIKYISEKENISETLNFYIAKKSGSHYQYSYHNLNRNIEEIFESFNIALDRMDLYGNTN